MREIEGKALSLFASSFGRHRGAKECRNGTVRIAKFWRDDHAGLQELDNLSVQLLANGFSKWPQEEACRDATVAVASEIRRRKNRLIDFTAQGLANLVNALSKWPDKAACRQATVAIADEVLWRELADFNRQHLVNLVNGFSKWPDEAACRDATVAIAGEILRRTPPSDFRLQDLATPVSGLSEWPDEAAYCDATVGIAEEVRRRQLTDLTPLDLAGLVNGLSKWPEAKACREATVAIAAEVLRRENRLFDFNQQDLANLVNGLSKWPEEAASRKTTVALAGEVLRRDLSDITRQHLATLVNGLSKWPEEAACREATVAIAAEVLRRGLADFSRQHLMNLANGFSKWPDEAACRDATVAIAGEIVRRARSSEFRLQDLATPVNGLSKWPDEAAYCDATVGIAGEVRRRQLTDLTPLDLANLVNGLSKWPEEAACRDATVALAGAIRRQLSDFTQQGLSNLVNGLSKWPEEAACRKTTVALAGEVLRRNLSDITRQHLATLVNGLSKWPEEAACREATVAIAAEVLRRENRLFDFNQQDLANLVNGLSKCPEEAACRDATVAIAGEVCRRELSGVKRQHLVNIVNGLSKWPEEEACREAAVAITGEVLRRERRFSEFTLQDLATLGNGFSKWPESAPCRGAMFAIAGEVRQRQLSDLTQLHLANLVNGLSKWPEEAAFREAAVALAGEVRRRKPSDFTQRHLANLVNGLSKWPEERACREATLAIAGEVLRRESQLLDLTQQDLVNLVHGLSRWPEERACRQATVAMAGEVRRRELSDFTQRQLANLVHGLSRWPEEEACREATVMIADEIHRRARRLFDVTQQDLALLVNGFSKWPEKAACREATVALAGEVLRRELSDVTRQHFVNLVNALSKWPEEEACRKTTVVLAGEILRRENRLSDFNRQDLATLVNGLSKWPQEAACREAMVVIAGEVPRRQFSDFTQLHLANLVNGLSKWPEEAACRDATVAIAGEVLRRELSDFTQRDLAILVNGLSKWSEEEACREATSAICAEVLRRKNRLFDFSQQDLAILVNGLSKWPEDEACREATVAIAAEVLHENRRSDSIHQDLGSLVNGFSKRAEAPGCRDATIAIAGEVHRRQLSDFVPQQLANLLNGFGKWLDEAQCRQAIMDIAGVLGIGHLRFGAFTTLELSMVANALARGIMEAEDNGEFADAALPKDRLHKLAHYLYYDNARLEQADVLHIATIFKALGKARLVDDLGLLAPTGLNRLAHLRQGPDFATRNDLETMGNLCAALLPLARSPQKPLRWHRRQALNLLNDLQAVVEHKIEAHLNASDAERIRGPLASRCPALSIYQTLKARAVLKQLFRPPYVEGKRPDLKIRQQQLEQGTREILASARDLIQGDLSRMSWNLIAQIEADNPVDALDSFMEQDAATIQAQHPASVFDVHQVLRAMDHAPRPPEGEAGLMQLPVVDMQGRPVATEPETRYSIFHRLTSGALPVVAVQLPAAPSAFMLARTVSVDGVPYRMDLFGGSKLKPPRLTIPQMAARTPDEPAKASGGKLLAIPYADTAPDTAFEQLSRAWAPFKEAYYYTQRRGFAAPPAIKGLSPHGYALEGAFKLALLPDRPANEEHPFKLSGPDGPIALRPHDGCGFIKGSLAKLMPAVRRAGEREGPDQVPAFGEGRKSALPVSALQHYPRSEQVAVEAKEKARRWLESKKGQELTSEELFRTVTAANINGPGAVAVPSADGCLHVPTLKSETLSGGGVLIGRSPYDKPNLRPFAAQRVKSAAVRDPTAAFLDRCVTIQYSFNVAQKSKEELAADDPTFFAKGLLIVVPDDMWPSDFAERGLVMSAEDVKCHSSWTRSKERARVDTPIDCVGILQATEVFAPGSVVAVPPAEQAKLDGDFDGDTVIIIGDRPQLYEHVRQFDQEGQARGFHSLKPPKSHTPAIEEDRYQFSRASQILAATQDVLETYTGLLRGFLAQSHEARCWFAERAVFGTFEGIHRDLRRDTRDLLDQEQLSAQDVHDKLDRARREIEVAKHPVAREIAELLVADLEAWAARLDQHVQPDNAGEAKLAVSTALSALFPDLAELYPATPQPRDRVLVLLDHYPARIDPRPDGYNPNDLVRSANNLLSLGIKVGTDAYKSDTGVRTFKNKSPALQALLQQTPGSTCVPYTKGIAATLHQGRFDADTTLQNLKDNPTLAASIMQAAIELVADKRILPKRLDRRGTTADDQATISLTRGGASQRAQIEASRAEAEEKEITATALSVAETLRNADIQVTMPYYDHRLRSNLSMTDQLIGMPTPSEAVSQLISNAVRHVFEIASKDYVHAFKKAMLAFDERGYSEVSTNNWFRMRRPTTFVGIKTVLATPQGYRFEVEFHTPESYEAKITNHDIYKELHKLLRQTSRDESEQIKLEELTQRLREVCKHVAIPDGAQDIPHWGIEGESRAGIGGTFEPKHPASDAKSPTARAIVAGLHQRPIVLVGMMGAGKSSIGPVLARQLALPFVDSDKVIEARTGKTIKDIFDDDGEAYFRDLEADEIMRWLGRPVVLATGGGAFMTETTRQHIGDKAVSIWLNTSEDLIRRNLSKDTKRPKMQTADRDQTITELMDARNPIYQLADLRIAPQNRRDLNSADACLSVLYDHLCNGERTARTPANDRNEEPAP